MNDPQDRPSPDPDARFFSLDEANRMLPLVRRIVEDIVAQYAQIEPDAARLATLSPAQRRGGEGRALKAKVDAGMERLDALIAEIHDLGCLFKGFQEGLVDWYSYYADRPVFLCWKLGEPTVGWWHQIDAGFIGRQPILPAQREAFRGE